MTSKLLQKFLKRSQIHLTWTHNLCEFHHQSLPLSCPETAARTQRPTGGSAEAAAVKIADLPKRAVGMLAMTALSQGKEEATRACQCRKSCS